MVVTSHVVIGSSVTGIDDSLQLRHGQRQQQVLLRKQNDTTKTNVVTKQEQQEQERELEYYFGGDHGGGEEEEEGAFLQDGLFLSSFGHTTIIYNVNVNQAVNINAHEISGNIELNQVSIPYGAAPGHNEEEEEEQQQQNDLNDIMELVDEDGDFQDERENNQMSDVTNNDGDDHDDNNNGVGETTTNEGVDDADDDDEESSIPSDTPSLSPNSMITLSYVPSDAPSLVPTNMPTKKTVCACSSLPKCNLCFNTDPSIGDTSLLYQPNAQCCDEGECNKVSTCPTACKVIPTDYGGACVADNNSKLGRCTEIFFSNQCDLSAPVPCCLEGFGGGCYVSKCDGST